MNCTKVLFPSRHPLFSLQVYSATSRAIIVSHSSREGREEGIRLVVRRMLESGMAISLVSDMTGLSIERVRALSTDD